jgi:hypothetical protein
MTPSKYAFCNEKGPQTVDTEAMYPDRPTA